MGETLTEREWEVLRIVARFKTDQEVAGELCISVHTVNKHVSSILAKLGLPSRRDAARWFWENG